MTANPYKVGDLLEGVDTSGKRFEGEVTAIRGPQSVVLDDRYVTPLSLIRGKKK